MIYLSGVTNDRDEPALIGAGIGLLVQPGNSYHLRVDRYPHFAADNGCFGGKWDEDKHLAWLDRLPRTALFAVAPDVYPDAQATLELSAGYFELIRDMGFPVALVAQDGAEHLDLPWDDFDCLFIGGERQEVEWKLGPYAEQVARAARAHGKWVHMGRVNSLKRMDRARSMGCLSADGTLLKWRRRVLPDEDSRAESDDRSIGALAHWQSWLHRNPPLPLSRFETPSLPVHRAALDVPILEAL